MNVLRDTLLSLIIAGMVLLTVLKISSNAREHVITTGQTYINQSNMRVLTDVIEYDFHKIGHSLIDPFHAIRTANSSQIIFSYDQNPTSTFDSIRVEYSTSPAPSTPNPDDKLLVRKVNNRNTRAVAFGVSTFQLRYFNQFGTELPTPVVTDSLPKIREIEITLILQSTEGFKKTYASSKYVTRIAPKNLLIQFSG